jgi:hypothetical protein|tara:strand:+ start:898 stop:1071 length:174 start_codon:yes stop_codon:yes gene_type:complete
LLFHHIHHLQKEHSYLEANKKPITNVKLCFYQRTGVVIIVEETGKLLTRFLSKAFKE